MAAFEVIALDTATPQLRAPGASDTYTFPRAVEMPLGTANGVLFLNGSKVVTSGSGLTFDGTSVFAAPRVRLNDANRLDWGDQGEWIVGDNGGAMLFGVDVSEKMRLTSTGLGIGTSSPAVRLDVFSSATEVARFVRNSVGVASGGITIGNNTRIWTLYGDSGSMSFWDSTAGAERMRLDASGNLGLGVTPSAWGGPFVAFQVSRAGLRGSTATSGLSFNAYYDGSNFRYIASSLSALDYYQNSGKHVWQIAPPGTAGNAISFTEAMTLDVSGNLLVGVTTTSGSSSNGKFLTGGVFTTVNGASASTASGAAVTLFAAPSESTFMVTAYIFGAGAPASYNAVAIVKVSGGVATITTISSASNMTLSISGLNVQATQTSGASQSISYSAMRIA